MSALIDVALVAAGGALGAVSRYLLERGLARTSPTFPLGILVANVAGSFLLGLLIATVAGPWLVFLGVGFCGALTTYSTFAHDSVRLARESRRGLAVANVGLSVALGLGALAVGLAVAGA